MRIRLASHPLPILGALLMVIGALLVPFGVLLGQAHKVLTTEESFVDSFAPLAADREVQDRVAELVVNGLEVPSLAGHLAEWGAPTWLVDPVGEALESGIESVVVHVLQTDEFATAWKASLRVSHAQVLEQLRTDARGAASPVVLNARPVLTAIRDALMREGTPVAHLIPQVDYTIVLIPAGDAEEIRKVSSLILRAGPWLPWAPVALIGLGVLLTRERWTWLAATCAIVALTAISIRLLGTNGAFAEWLSPGPHPDPITSAASRALLDATFSSSLSTLTLIAVFSAGGAAAAGGIRLVRRRRSP